MNYKLIKAEELQINDYGSIKVQDYLNDILVGDMSLAKVEIVGEQEFGRNTESNIIYYILKGKGLFYIEDDWVEVKEGDAVFIPKNTKYKDSGIMTLLAFSSPRFKSENSSRD